MCSISRDPRWEECTICTAVVFTVRTYGTGPAYGPRLVRKSDHCKPRNRRSANRGSAQSQNVAQLRF